ncbi:hypothetical protein BDP55DRAFT_374354 [Colletotrichum godetiae]|uniref:Uncharacterized protein n=1 Tax=Colletotrichum godetiae TaxID=1209918 RepID=A0AAJ0A903_9PEZI|nr:uncharacterized protein BDP55DRAFT_374354 [Colletotrichum godetiae]KAK1658746.1 hypothetical protein BDP55DRAFT_374354 [Colletotrichum godetiae]
MSRIQMKRTMMSSTCLFASIGRAFPHWFRLNAAALKTTSTSANRSWKNTERYGSVQRGRHLTYFPCLCQP